jgi:hypothetical protein
LKKLRKKNRNWGKKRGEQQEVRATTAAQKELKTAHITHFTNVKNAGKLFFVN